MAFATRHRCKTILDGRGEVTNDARRVQILIHLLAGATLVIAAIAADFAWGHPANASQYVVAALAATGLAISAAGFLPAGAITRFSSRACLSFLSLLIFIGVGEAVFRVVAYDFSSEERAWRATAPYFRMPIHPHGEVFFRREGPESWTGRILYSHLEAFGVTPNPYADEPEITVDYDRNGFRNPADMTDWGIAVAGDSFTELGFLPHHQLFTSILGEELGVAVLNLGTSYTGPLTQLSYLRAFGTSAGTKHCVIVFFEGNDLWDLSREHQMLVRWEKGGGRDHLRFQKQSSLVVALREGACRLFAVPQRPPERDLVSAYFNSPHGDVPVTLEYVPGGGPPLPDETVRHLERFFTGYAGFAEERGVTAWLAYMPAKRRVLHGHLTFVPDVGEAMRGWEPTGLPEAIRELCDRHGARFIDLTPALIAETEEHGRLVYNSLADTHLNARGSRVVAQELARHLREFGVGGRNEDPLTPR